MNCKYNSHNKKKMQNNNGTSSSSSHLHNNNKQESYIIVIYQVSSLLNSSCTIFSLSIICITFPPPPKVHIFELFSRLLNICILNNCKEKPRGGKIQTNCHKHASTTSIHIYFNYTSNYVESIHIQLQGHVNNFLFFVVLEEERICTFYILSE